MRMILILISAGAALALAACGSSDPDKAQVVATTGILASIAGQVAGDDAEVTQLIPDSASPHEFSLSADDRRELEEADLIASNGAGLEPGVPVEEADAPSWALADAAGPLLPLAEAGTHEDEPATAEEGSDVDPHLWMDPTRVARAAPELADALAAADPDHAGGYRQRAQALSNRLRELDREIARRVSALPVADRELVTSHDALGYFAERYDLRVIATALPSSGPEAEPSAQALAEVADAIRDSGVPAVFAEETDDPQVLEQVAEETDVEVVTDLLVEAPGSAGSYEEMLRHDADRIVGALGG
jgi:zinc/manganese transport system substrate-binding protein